MSNYCKVIILGNVTRDPEVRFLPKGTAVCEVTLAVNRKWKNDAGEACEEVSFVDCSAFGRTAEIIGEWVKKGDPLLVDGRLRQENWTDKTTGAKRSKLKVVVESMHLMGTKKSADGAAPVAPLARSPAPAESGGPIDPDEIPF